MEDGQLNKMEKIIGLIPSRLGSKRLPGKPLLKINGKLIIEIGHKQKNRTVKTLNQNGFYINKVSKDLAGKERCIISTKL